MNLFLKTAETTTTTTQDVLSLDALLARFFDWLLTEGVKILIAFVIMFIAFAVANAIVKSLRKFLEKKHADKTISKTITYILNWVLKVIIILALLGYLGIDTSGVAALITSIGVGVGLALQGSLANVAGGVLIILLRPFRVDDFIEAQGVSGTVEDIHLIYTYIRTPDNKVVALPNGNLANNVIINYNKKDTRRVDFEFSIAYSADYKKAEAIVLELMNAHEKVLKETQPTCRIVRHDPSSITLTAKAWTMSGDYWDVYFNLNETVRESFTRNHVEMSYGHLNIHVCKD